MKKHADQADFWSINIFEDEHEEIMVRLGIPKAINTSFDRGALILMQKDGAIGYYSTQDLSDDGIALACKEALKWALQFKKYSLLNGSNISFAAHHGNYLGPGTKFSAQGATNEKFSLLKRCDEILKSSQYAIDSESSLWSINIKSQFFNSLGSEIEQHLSKVVPNLSVTVSHRGITQIRTLGGNYCLQGDFATIKGLDLEKKAGEIIKDAVDLVSAANCPTDFMDIVIDSDQMMLQIHESIGHPLELDRILGDERNYAGTSFVTLDMFGAYQYGSSLLNITFDPSIKEQFASYGFDDEGLLATKEFLIQDGILLRPLGGTISSARASMSAVANARFSSWNRPPIDRMANLNLEPGSSTFLEMIESIKYGIFLKSNSSWSIDDSRNKFQFGCEWGQIIRDGKLAEVVRNPNYRGISANFWRNLSMVGDKSTFKVMGTPFCGKGEPNQCIQVGHASPVCKFVNVDVFGGE